MKLGSVENLNSGGVSTFIAPDGKSMTTGIRKLPLTSAQVTRAGFPGDASTDAQHHTAEKTVHFFAVEAYRALEAKMAISLPRPSFGENIAATGVSEDQIFVGDLLQIGSVRLLVTQPTERCKAIGRSLGLPKILKAMYELEVSGFYASVVEGGDVAVGDAITLINRPQPIWSIKRLHRAMFRDYADEALIEKVNALPELSDEWKSRLAVMRGRAKRGEPMSSNLVDL